VKLRHMAANLLRVHAPKRHPARKCKEGLDVAGVICDGEPAQAAFVGQVLQIAAHEGMRSWNCGSCSLGVSAHLHEVTS
jgi:hypothetical protein